MDREGKDVGVTQMGGVWAWAWEGGKGGLYGARVC